MSVGIENVKEDTLTKKKRLGSIRTAKFNQDERRESERESKNTRKRK